MEWHGWNVSIIKVSENIILATLLSALSPNLTKLQIAGEQLQDIDTRADQGMTING